MKYTYLLIDGLSLLFPLLFSFHPRLQFYQKWPALFPAIFSCGLGFIAWDSYFTHLKVWGFNPAYLSGLFVGNLPLEEILFFLCIPYACVFTYECLPRLGSAKKTTLLSLVLIIGSAILTISYHWHLYTAVTFALLGALISMARFGLQLTWLSRFYRTYLILLVPFLLVNGLLTGTGLASPVVWYNPAEIIGLRLLTIPLEDVFYGMALILLNLIIYNRLLKTRHLK